MIQGFRCLGLVGSLLSEWCYLGKNLSIGNVRGSYEGNLGDALRNTFVVAEA